MQALTRQGVHLNLLSIREGPGFSLDGLTPHEVRDVGRFVKWSTVSTGYALEQGTKPSTVAHALASSPIALLAWIGEKLHEMYAVPHLGMDYIINMVSFWWLTETAPTSLYAYRDVFAGRAVRRWSEVLPGQQMHIPEDKPLGYSSFPNEISITPRSWVAKCGRLVFYRKHEKVGRVRLLCLGFWKLTVHRAGILLRRGCPRFLRWM